MEPYSIRLKIDNEEVEGQMMEGPQKSGCDRFCIVRVREPLGFDDNDKPQLQIFVEGEWRMAEFRTSLERKCSNEFYMTYQIP